MQLKLARMPYINVDPFYYELEHAGKNPDIELVSGYPRQIGRLAGTKDTIDAAPISVMDFLNLQQSYEPLGRMCVAVKEKAGSVNLFTKIPAEELGNHKIGITSQTSTSRVLMHLILEHRYGVKSAEYLDQPEQDDVDAYLLIGDNALVHAYHGLKGFRYRYDLGEEWYKWTGLPFVFALWAVRKALAQKDKDYLTGVLSGSIDTFWQHEGEMAQTRADELQLSPGSIRDYWHLFIYHQTTAVDKSLEMFVDSIQDIKGVFAHGQEKI